MNTDFPNESAGPGDVVTSSALTWTDTDRREWRVTLDPDAIVLDSGSDRVVLPRDAWDRDVYAARHGDRWIVRIETFDRAIGFLLPTSAAEPVFAHLRRSLEVSEPLCEQADSPQEVCSPRAPLLWPKVSPLAVWSVITAALTFVPGIGWALSVVTITLLILHRRTVRRSAAMRHSRSLCVFAFAFMCVGLATSLLVSWGIAHFADQAMVGQTIAARSAAESDAAGTWGMIAAGIVVVLFSLSVHEAAHAITAWWLGDGYAHSLGRVTLNPLAHIDPFGTVVLPIVLALFGGVIFGYARPVPVRVELLPRHHRAHILISIAGPGSNLLIAAASLMFLFVLGCGLTFVVPDASVTNLSSFDFLAQVKASGFAGAPVFGAACTVLKLSFVINVVLALFNLIPLPPLDGSWVLEHLFPRTLGDFYARIRPYGFLIFLAVLYFGWFEYLLYPVMYFLGPSLALLGAATGF